MIAFSSPNFDMGEGKKGLNCKSLLEGLVKSHQPNLVQYDSQVNKANSQNYLFDIFKLTMEA